jgi:hypothetical protein
LSAGRPMVGAWSVRCRPLSARSTRQPSRVCRPESVPRRRRDRTASGVRPRMAAASAMVASCGRWSAKRVGWSAGGRSLMPGSIGRPGPYEPDLMPLCPARSVEHICLVQTVTKYSEQMFAGGGSYRYSRAIPRKGQPLANYPPGTRVNVAIPPSSTYPGVVLRNGPTISVSWTGRAPSGYSNPHEIPPDRVSLRTA